MKSILLLLAAAMSLPVMAQSDPHDISIFQSFGDSRNLYSGLMPKSSGTIGSAFIFDEMPKGDLMMANGKIYQGIYINIFPEKAEIFIRSEEKEDAKVVILDNKKVEKIIFEASERTFVPMKVEDKLHVAEIIVDGDEGKLVALHEKKFNKATVGGGYNSGPHYDSYQHIIRYYRFSEKGAEEIKSNKTGLKVLDSENWKTLQDYVKSNKLDLNDPVAMRKLYLHSLSLRR